MGKVKTPLKKSTEEDLDRFLVERAEADREGGAAQAAGPLFFADKSRDVSLARKVHERRNKVLHSDSILERKSLMPPVHNSKKSHKKSKEKDQAKPPGKPTPSVPVPAARKQKDPVHDMWGSEEKKRKKRVPEAIAPAVEVDAPGCSYNPTFDDHQEVLGLAVAQEMRKVYQRVLQPEAVPRTVEGSMMSEEEALFLDVDLDEDDEESDDDVGQAGSRVVKAKKLTRVDLNKKKRRREALKVEAEKQHQKKIRKDIARVPEMLEELETQDEVKERHRIRRIVSREERRAQGPPPLGRHKFVPDPVQVLTTEEVSGSLRKLKACYTLTRERFKSWQRRGLMEARAPSRKKKRRP